MNIHIEHLHMFIMQSYTDICIYFNVFEIGAEKLLSRPLPQIFLNIRILNEPGILQHPLVDTHLAHYAHTHIDMIYKSINQINGVISINKMEEKRKMK